MVDYQQLPHEGIRTLIPYKPGKSIAELAQEQGLSDIIKLASNENPLGCSPLVHQALADMPKSLFATYPSPIVHPFTKKLANHLQVKPDQLLISNGSDLIYQLLLAGFALHTNKHLLTHQYAFSTYQIQAKALGIPVNFAFVENWQVNVDNLIAACTNQTGLICLANPNNPTGLLISEEDLQKLLTQVSPETLVVLDEAYFEYARKEQKYNAIDWLYRYPNLVITRTFSKAYGLAGLRLGYAVANEPIIEILRRLQLPFIVSQTALEAGCAALEDQAFVEATLKCTYQGLLQISGGLEELGLDFIPSSCNFISFHCKQDGLFIYQQLLAQGIIVRPLHAYGMSEYLRVTIGTQEQNARFLNALRGIFYEN